jgi:serine protease Do
MQKKVIWLSILFFILTPDVIFTETGGFWRLFPVPMVEAEEILYRWLVDSNFEVSRISFGDSQVKIKGLKGNEYWEIVIKPHSPLASDILVKYTLHGKPSETRHEELWTFLEDCLKEPSLENESNQPVPVAILSKGEWVVCIRAKILNESIQFSGFLIEQKGLIISTAHDLKGNEEFTVILSNGQEHRGHLVKIDPLRDLTLIGIHSKSKDFLSLTKSRDLKGMGERVYSISCPIYDQGRIRTGTIKGPMRRFNNFPLWEAEMKIFPGSSGSPVFDGQGNLVAVVKGRYRDSDSIGFLIPIATVIEFINGK